MGWQAVERTLACGVCGGNLISVVIARTWHEVITLSDSWRCPGCGSAREADDYGLADEFRALFIAAAGRWTAKVQDAGTNRIAVGKRIRELLEVAPTRVMPLVRGEAPLLSGALIEVQLVQEVLARLGATVLLEQIESPPGPAPGPTPRD